MADIPKIEVYKSIREEVIEQKKCQFQILTAAITFTAAAWAFVSREIGNSLGYLAPIALNVAALIMILDKARSIQRMVGYLQIMEMRSDKTRWQWEFSLDRFRGKAEINQLCEKPAPVPSDSNQREPDELESETDKRKHSYITTVGVLLLVLSAFCVLFYAVALLSGGVQAQQQPEPTIRPLSAAVIRLATSPFFDLGFVAVLLGLVRFVYVRRELTVGNYSSSKIRKRWEDIIGPGTM
jgi:hypothetical protein